MSNPRQSVGFPEVAIIHKGSPKQKVVKGDKTIEIQGKDLNNLFRIHFLPGTEDVRKIWHEKHAGEYKKYGDKFAIPDGYEIAQMRVVVPAPTVWDAWDYGNEVYNAGRRIALADDDHYITLRDPLTGEYIIKDGEPYRPFTPKDEITYEKTINGEKKTITLIMKSQGRLRLVLEDLVNAGQLVQVILKTTSFYDCQNINRQLAGIQNIADMINGGNAGGIPIIIYRAEQEVAWNKPDGSAQRIKKWFINLKADPNWVKMAFASMGKKALAGSAMNNLMLPATSVTGPVDPDRETFESGDEDPNTVEGEFSEPEPEFSQPEEPAPTSDNSVKYHYLGVKIVNLVALQCDISKEEAAKYLGLGAKEGKIEKEITIDQAKEFAKHINV